MEREECQFMPQKSIPGQETFFSRVYALVARIPPGKIMTYGQISSVLGECSARYVGYAMAGAPPGLPCHRVVNRKGEMAPGLVFGGPDRQRSRLEAEGVPFTAQGRIDLAACLWRGDASGEGAAEEAHGYSDG